MIKLKKYQDKSLEILRSFLELARFEGIKAAYDKLQYQRYGNQNFKPFQPLSGLENTPYVCLRLPTGGGKTLLSAHTIALAGKAYIENEYPLTLWLVPTNTIKTQTLETLKNPDHANYQVLEKAFDGKFRVFDIADFRNIRQQDIADSACIVVSTFASLRVDNTEGRKAYDHDENLEPHFSKIPSNAEGMEKSEDGKIKFSFANLLNWHRPLVIVDEAHNAKTDLSVEVLRRVNASCVVEYTATPASNSNVIHSVTAAELKAEQMIKLPIILSEHISWEQAITNSIQTRQRLEELATKDADYIRPIILFQAENKDKEITVEVLEKYLTDNEGIDRKQIAIVTGDQKELDSIDLFNPNCEIRYVITVQALKEGWDCSFAYVLCSVANTKSATAVEQLLGRVLRMPYAKERTQADLNKAYAHVSSKSWPHAVTELHDRLVSMGFEKQEAEEVIYAQPSFLPQEKAPPFEMILASEPDLSNLDLAEKSLVSVNKISEGVFELKVEQGFNAALAEKLTTSIKDKKDRTEIALKAKIHIKHLPENLSPSQRGEIFVVPQLCLNFDGDVELAEAEICLDANGWSLLDYSTVLTKEEFTVDEEAKQYIADIVGQKIKIDFLNKSEQLSLEGIKTELDEIGLCRWLDKKLRAADIKQEILLEFLRRTVKNLLARDDIDMPKLVRGRFVLEKILQNKIALYRKAAYSKGYQSCMFGDKAISTISPENFSFSFDPNNYPSSINYEGKFGFSKHYYSRIGIMNDEEAECAFAIDQNPNVKFWVRNLERQPKYSFWLPTSTDKFYPDFLAQLNDGRILVIEYKGSQFAGSDDAEEKELIGKVWAEKSGNLFLMAWKSNDGKSIAQQINGIMVR
jgi:type III restriction enzyme